MIAFLYGLALGFIIANAFSYYFERYNKKHKDD